MARIAASLVGQKPVSTQLPPTCWQCSAQDTVGGATNHRGVVVGSNVGDGEIGLGDGTREGLTLGNAGAASHNATVDAHTAINKLERGILLLDATDIAKDAIMSSAKGAGAAGALCVGPRNGRPNIFAPRGAGWPN